MFNQDSNTTEINNTTVADEIKNLVMTEKAVAESDRLLKVFVHYLRETADKLDAERDGLRAATSALKGASERTKTIVLGGVAERTMQEIRRRVNDIDFLLVEQEGVHKGVIGVSTSSSTNN